MKWPTKWLKNRESGQAFMIVLAMLALGSLIIIPTLNLSSTSLGYHQEIETNTLETYAADAGVEYAMCKLGNDPEGYKVDPPVPVPVPGVPDVNGKTVNVTATHKPDIGEDVFLIISIATTDIDSSTKIESYVSILGADFSFLLDNAITSPGDITIQPGMTVLGDVQYNGTLDNKGTIDGDISTEPIVWPTAEVMSAYYWENVVGFPFLEDSIDVKDTTSIGPLLRDGSLSIDNTGSPSTLMLNGTVYVTGDLTFNQAGTTHAYTIDLNDQTIFVEGSITFPSSTCTLFGSGCIIAIGDINFQPQCSSSFDDFVFVMSIEGTVNFHPGGDFTGSLAGEVEVYLGPGNVLNWIQPSEGLDFPGFGDGSGGSGSATLSILTWQISN